MSGTSSRGDPIEPVWVTEVLRFWFDELFRDTPWAFAADTVARRLSRSAISQGFDRAPTRLDQLAGDVRAQIDHKALPEAVIAARYHHRLVSIHPFPNGNGRHARFMADLLLKVLTGKIFTWGQSSLGSGGEARTAHKLGEKFVATTFSHSL